MPADRSSGRVGDLPLGLSVESPAAPDDGRVGSVAFDAVTFVAAVGAWVVVMCGCEV